jgi:hypothetical protein
MARRRRMGAGFATSNGTGPSRRAILSALSERCITLCYSTIAAIQTATGNPPYSISPYSEVKRYSGKGVTTLHDAPPLRSAGRISSRAARRYHLVAVPPLDLGAMLTADRP